MVICHTQCPKLDSELAQIKNQKNSNQTNFKHNHIKDSMVTNQITNIHSTADQRLTSIPKC